MRGLNFNAVRRWLVALFLFLLSVQTRWIIAPGTIDGGPWEYGTLSLYATEIFIWILALLHIGPLRRVFRTRKNFWNVCSAILALTFASVAWAPDPRIALFFFFHFLSALLLVALLASIPREHLKLALGAFVMGVGVQAALALSQAGWQWVHPSTFLGIAEQNPVWPGVSVVEHAGERFLRAYGGLPHPNILGGYLVAGALILGSGFLEIRRRWHWMALLAASALLLSALFFTFSRAAWVGFVTGLVVLCVARFVYKRKLYCEGAPGESPSQMPVGAGGWASEHTEGRRRPSPPLACKWGARAGGCEGSVRGASDSETPRHDEQRPGVVSEPGPPRQSTSMALYQGSLILVALSVIVSLIFGFIFRDAVAGRLGGDSRLEAISYTERISGVSEAWELIKERPVFGWGAGNYTAAAFELDPGRPAWDYQPVHNVPLLVLTELGIVGFLLLLILAGLVWRTVFQRLPVSIFVALIVISLFDHYLWSLYPGLVLGAAVLGFLLNQAKNYS